MPLPIIADTVRAAVRGTLPNADRWTNVLHFRKSGGLTFAGAIAVLDPILDSHYSAGGAGLRHWTQLAPTNATMDEIRYTPLDGTTATTVVTHSHAGTVASEALPANVALVVTLRTALRGRSHRGRVYTGPWTESANQAAGVPSTGDVGGLATTWSNLLTSLAGTGVSLVVASYHLSTASDVTACTVDSRWDSQRRRLG